jgi:hypothetical protein
MHNRTSVRTLLAALAFAALAAPAAFAQLDPVFDDGQFHPIWNKKDLSNWKEHSSNWRTEYVGTDTASIYTDGLAHPGSMTHMIYGKKVTNNMELRAVMRMPATGGANAGFQFRSRCESPTGTLDNSCGGSPWIACGPQMDMGATYSGDIYNGCSGAYVNNNTVSKAPTIVNNTPSCRASSNFKGVDQWNTYLIRILNDTAWTFLNGVNCSKYYLTAATDRQATSQGLISLQYETQLKVEFRSVELKNLDAKPVAIGNAADPGRIAWALRAGDGLRGGKHALSYSIPDAGAYSIKVADLRGQVIRSEQGAGPVDRRDLDLGASGLFLVEIRSARGALAKRILAD